jgi:hypothetical protein
MDGNKNQEGGSSSDPSSQLPPSVAESTAENDFPSSKSYPLSCDRRYGS